VARDEYEVMLVAVYGADDKARQPGRTLNSLVLSHEPRRVAVTWKSLFWGPQMLIFT
jgi:hypothetical protein